jgi:hypothetical protein
LIILFSAFAKDSPHDILWQTVQTYQNFARNLAYHQSALGYAWWQPLPDLSDTVPSLEAGGKFSLRVFVFLLAKAANEQLQAGHASETLFEKFYKPSEKGIALKTKVSYWLTMLIRQTCLLNECAAFSS